MMKYRRLLCIGLTAVTTLSMIGCGKDKSVSYDPLTEEDDTIYTISVCQDADNDYYNTIALGFNDALTDLFGDSHIQVISTTADETTGTDSICTGYVNQNTQLIFANGEQSLSSASTATDTIPIVGAGVMDYPSALHLMTSNADWNKKTGINVTGVSAEPDIEAQLSLLIEATPELTSVGLLYNPEDTDAIYQNALLEQYLDEAGIPWKEYAIPLDPQETTANHEVSDLLAVAPTKRVAASATEGPNNNVESFGENDLLNGIFSPNSAHVAAVSATWTPELSAANPGELASDASLEEIVQYACNECSSLFIPAGSELTNHLETIADIATVSGTRTVGGDASLGQQTLVSLYSDPYAMGYAAGKLVYRILVNNDAPGDIKISTASAENVKLYNASRAEALGMTFPKSFSEINSFFETYEIGSTTTRISSADEDAANE